MADEQDHERRISRLETRVEEAADDASTARHLAAAGDRDIADLGVKVDAHRQAIHALGLKVNSLEKRVDQRFEQVDARFERLERRVDEGFEATDRGFTEMRGRLDATAAGQEQVVGLLNRLLDESA